MENVVQEGGRRGGGVGESFPTSRSPRRYQVGFCPTIPRIVHSGGVTE